MAKEFNPYTQPGSMDDPASEELYQKNSVMAPPSSRLRKIMDFIIGKTAQDRMTNAVTQMAPAAIIPGKKIPGVFQGKLKGYAGNPNATNSIDAQNLHMKDAPFVVGDIEKLPLDSKGSYSALLNPTSGKMAYTEALHSHDPLQQAGLTYLEDLDNDQLYGRIRRVAYQGAGGEKGVTHVVPPYTSPNALMPIRQEREQMYLNRIAKMLEQKGLLPAGEDVQYHSFWK